jgi:hypothetical protein
MYIVAPWQMQRIFVRAFRVPSGISECLSLLSLLFQAALVMAVTVDSSRHFADPRRLASTGSEGVCSCFQCMLELRPAMNQGRRSFGIYVDYE